MTTTCQYGGGNCTPTTNPTPVPTVPSTPHYGTPTSLAFTGYDAIGFAGIGLGLVIAGYSLIVRARKARVHA